MTQQASTRLVRKYVGGRVSAPHVGGLMAHPGLLPTGYLAWPAALWPAPQRGAGLAARLSHRGPGSPACHCNADKLVPHS